MAQKSHPFSAHLAYSGNAMRRCASCQRRREALKKFAARIAAPKTRTNKCVRVVATPGRAATK